MNAPRILVGRLDGSRIPAFWLPQGYAWPTLAEQPVRGSQVLPVAVRWVDPEARSRGRVALDGADVTPPEEHVRR